MKKTFSTAPVTLNYHIYFYCWCLISRTVFIPATLLENVFEIKNKKLRFTVENLSHFHVQILLVLLPFNQWLISKFLDIFLTVYSAWYLSHPCLSSRIHSSSSMDNSPSLQVILSLMKIIDIVKFTVMLYVQYIIIVRENGNKTSCTVYVFLILLPLSQNELLFFIYFSCAVQTNIKYCEGYLLLVQHFMGFTGTCEFLLRVSLN